MLDSENLFSRRKLNCELVVKYLGLNSDLWGGGGGGGGDLASPQYLNNRQLLRCGLRDAVGVV